MAEDSAASVMAALEVDDDDDDWMSPRNSIEDGVASTLVIWEVERVMSLAAAVVRPRMDGTSAADTDSEKMRYAGVDAHMPVVVVVVVAGE